MNYTPVPEGALAPNLFFTSQDTLNYGQQLQFGVAFKNISITAFDSMSINITVIDHNNVSHLVQLPKKRPIISGDTLIVSYTIDTKAYPGSNTIYLDVNPSNAQPEQFHFNNFLYKNFYVRTDNVKPLLDVTFDGVHILNQDIVSARPHITIKLKDESKFLLLTDTSSINVQVRYPDGSLHTYSFNTDTLGVGSAPREQARQQIIQQPLIFTPHLPSNITPKGMSILWLLPEKMLVGTRQAKYGELHRYLSRSSPSR